MWKEVGSLDLLVYLGGSIWKWVSEDPGDAVYQGDSPQAFAYGMKRLFRCRKEIPFQFPRAG